MSVSGETTVPPCVAAPPAGHGAARKLCVDRLREVPFPGWVYVGTAAVAARVTV